LTFECEDKIVQFAKGNRGNRGAVDELSEAKVSGGVLQCPQAYMPGTGKWTMITVF